MFKKIKVLMMSELTKGTTPRSLALACAVGVVLGNFPVMGTTTSLCLLAGAMLRLNQPFLQLVNYIMMPSQVLLIPVFLWMGETLLGLPHMSLNPSLVYNSFIENKTVFFEKFGMAGLHAILAWVLIAPVVGMLVFLISREFFIRVMKRIQEKQIGV